MPDEPQKLTEDLMERIFAGVEAGLTPKLAARSVSVPFDVHVGWLLDGLGDVEDGKKDTLPARYALGLQQRAQSRRARAAARAIGDEG